MKVDILTLFPDFFLDFKNWSIIGRAVEKSIIDINCTNIRDFSNNKHRKVDDYPFGGGPGMVMSGEPIYKSINSVRTNNSKIIYLSPQGEKLNQRIINDLSQEEHLVLLCGHYEGVDNRIIENYIDMEISIGDYVLTGGELPAMVLIDSITRLLPGVLSSEESFYEESHYNNILEHPQYTRPRDFNGLSVPEVLLSGNHEKIAQWKRYAGLKNTLIKRPDLIEKAVLNDEDRKYLAIIAKELNDNI